VLKIHTSDGQTTIVDLKDEASAKEFLSKLRSTEEQQRITGATATRRCSGRFYCETCGRTVKAKCSRCGAIDTSCGKSAQFSLSRPIGFERVWYHIEHIEPDPTRHIRGGDKITCFVDDVRLDMMVHSDQPSTKVSLVRTGVQRYNPMVED